MKFIEVHTWQTGNPNLVNADEIGRCYSQTQYDFMQDAKVDHAVIVFRGAANEGDSRMLHVKETYDDIAHMIGNQYRIATLENARQT